ncbi:hypothetical protein CTAYLR_000789 [Chrysophaeum taylorii]|uniref:Spindle pole body component n=1 Tax=Chrysophaeum taylorii TaxID=2483200 RepID=A0AAD7UPL8_9STRA|nr:hypothetical protein CTAYLR_000789 [Chrysophaeum taylorii]
MDSSVEVRALVGELAAAVLETAEAPRPVVDLCWRVLGSRLRSRQTTIGREAIAARLESQRDPRQAMRFEELLISLRASGAVDKVESLVAVLGELSRLDGGVSVGRLGQTTVLPISTACLASGEGSVAGSSGRVVAERTREQRGEQKQRQQQPFVWSRDEQGGFVFAKKETGAPFVTEEAKRCQVPMSVSDAEARLVRDVLWCLQGIDGKHAVYRASDETFSVDRGVCAKLATLDRTRELCELGWLYRKVAAYARSERNSGLVDAALRSALADELGEYYRLVAVLEARLNRRQDEAHRLSLRRLAVWTSEPLERLKVMASVADAVSEARGGALLSVLDARGRHGDPKVREFLTALAARTAEPMFGAVRRWLFAGDLAPDPHGEFFVYEDEPPPPTRRKKKGHRGEEDDETSSATFWRSRYGLRRAMVPSFVRGSEAQILVVGKALNFLKRCCSKKSTTPLPEEEGDDLAFRYGHGDRLARLVRRVAAATNSRVRSALVDDLSLVEHLRTLKACVLLMQGDFAVRLVDALEPHLVVAADRKHLDDANFGSRANVVRHDVWTAFDAAVRASNARALKTLDCLRVAIVRGRDDITLDYDPPAPIDAVVDANALSIYRVAHAVFLRRARVEAKLAKAWRQHMTARRAAFSKKAAARVFHRTALARARIAQLVTALGAYCCSVVEDQWRRLDATVASESAGLDEIVEAHRQYLAAIETQALFKPTVGGDNDVADLLARETALATAMTFCSLVDALVADAFVAEDDAALVDRIDATIHDFDATSAKLRTTLSAASDEATANLAFRLECCCW